MKTHHRFLYIVVICYMFLAGAVRLSAYIILSMEEIGPDVVISYSGSVNLTDLINYTSPGSLVISGGFSPGSIASAPSDLSGSAVVEEYGFLNPKTFLLGDHYFGVGSDLNTGDAFGISDGQIPFGEVNVFLQVPMGYISGEPLSGTSTFTDTTLADLQAFPGTYTWTWGSGGNADYATLTIVPEPALLAMMSGLMVLGIVVWRRLS